MNVPGRLHNLCLEIEEDTSSWLAFSSHFVTLAANVVERRSASASQSVTPSPQKQRKVTKPALYDWTLRLCQTVNEGGNGNGSNKIKERGKEKKDESETESEGEASIPPPSQLLAWYAAQINLSQSVALLEESGEESWDMLELRVRVAWDSSVVDVMGIEEDRASDGTYTSIKLAFDSNGIDEEGVDGKAKIEVILNRLRGRDELLAASIVSKELAKGFNVLKGQTDSLKQERDSHRKLLQNNRRHERFKEANSSLVNPGRLKRKIQDDEGFEGDEDEEVET